MCVSVQASDGSSSRDDLPAQLLRRNDQIRRLEAKLSGGTRCHTDDAAVSVLNSWRDGAGRLEDRTAVDG